MNDFAIIQIDGFYVYQNDVHFVEKGSELARYQSRVREEAYKHLQKFRTAVDIGGHIGIFSRDFSTRFDCVHAFEPMPHNFKLLDMNLKKFNNVICNNCGIGKQNGWIEMGYNSKNSGGSECIDPNKIFDPETNNIKSDF